MTGHLVLEVLERINTCSILQHYNISQQHRRLPWPRAPVASLPVERARSDSNEHFSNDSKFSLLCLQQLSKPWSKGSQT